MGRPRVRRADTRRGGELPRVPSRGHACARRRGEAWSGRPDRLAEPNAKHGSRDLYVRRPHLEWPAVKPRDSARGARQRKLAGPTGVASVGGPANSRSSGELLHDTGASKTVAPPTATRQTRGVPTVPIAGEKLDDPRADEGDFSAVS